MKKTILKIVLLLLTIENSFGQFVKFYNTAAFIPSHGAAISHIALAGGGVVLRGVAKPRHQDALPVFKNVYFIESGGLSKMTIHTSGPDISFSDSAWLMRDAAMLVKFESADTIYRDVNILGKFSRSDSAKGLDYIYPANEFYNVEMADPLIKSMSGQTLLYLDLILASNPNSEYYSTDHEAYERYIDSKGSLEDVIRDYQDSIYKLNCKPINDIYLKLQKFDSLPDTEKSDTNEVKLLDRIRQYSVYYLFSHNLERLNYPDSAWKYAPEIDSLFDAAYSKSTDSKPVWTDYTYNDEYTNYWIDIDKSGRYLEIDGTPNYTFLYHKYKFSDDGTLQTDEPQVDSLFTNYYAQHYSLIRDLNPIVFTYAEHFSKIAAFYRYLKSEYPNLWNQIYLHYLHTKKREGHTPRFIGNHPLKDY